MKFRLARLDPGELDSLDLEQLRDNIVAGVPQQRRVVMEDGSRVDVLEIARDPQLIRDDSGEPESLYIRYVIRQAEQYPSVADGGFDETRIYEPKSVTDFVLLANGDIAYESGGSPLGPLGLLLDDPDPRGRYVAGIPLAQDVIQAHFDDADRVSKVAFAMDEYDPEDQPGQVTTLSEAAQEMAAHAENNSFTVGHYHRTRDLRQITFIQELAGHVEIKRVSASHGDENSIELAAPGWTQFNVPTDIDAQQRATVIRNRVEVLF